MSIYKGTQLISGVATPVEAGRNMGQIIQSLLPLTDAGLHLLDGTVISGDGIYSAFVDYIKTLDLTASYFTTEVDWQASVSQYGVCGKFVYNASANTVRLPKVTGFVEGTIDPSALGDLVEQFVKLPNITGAFETSDRGHVTTGAFYTTGGAAARGDNNGGSGQWINLDASRASSVYSGNGADTKIQPQSILGYMYIVVATSAKTDIEVDIDNIVTDLNQKVDISNMVEVPTIIEVSDPSLMPSWYRVYSDGWCEQGIYKAWGDQGSYTFLKPYKDENWTLVSNGDGADQSSNIGIISRTATGFSFNNANQSFVGSMLACGYIA